MSAHFNIFSSFGFGIGFGIGFDIGISVSISVSILVLVETKIFFQFLYRFWPKRKMAVLASFGFGRNEKKPFGRPLIRPGLD